MQAAAVSQSVEPVCCGGRQRDRTHALCSCLQPGPRTEARPHRLRPVLAPVRADLLGSLIGDSSEAVQAETGHLSCSLHYQSMRCWPRAVAILRVASAEPDAEAAVKLQSSQLTQEAGGYRSAGDVFGDGLGLRHAASMLPCLGQGRCFPHARKFRLSRATLASQAGLSSETDVKTPAQRVYRHHRSLLPLQDFTSPSPCTWDSCCARPFDDSADLRCSSHDYCRTLGFLLSWQH